MRNLKTFTINFKKFKEQDKNKIIDLIINKYKMLYSNMNLQIEYKKKQDAYTFFLIGDMNIITINGIEKQNILIAKYTNIEAIDIFDPNMEYYLTIYDDSRKDYKKQLKEYIENLILSYRLINSKPIDFKMTEKEYVLYIKIPSTLMGAKVICDNFEYNILTEEQYKRFKSKIKNELKRILNV